MKKRGVLIALTNPVAGKEAEYNDWYNNVHLADLMKMPGVVGAKRYKIATGQHVAAGTPWKYLATYDLECEDLNTVAQELKRRRGPTGHGTAEMAISPALDEKREAWFFEEIFEYKAKK
jgi:hypothetical protein